MIGVTRDEIVDAGEDRCSENGLIFRGKLDGCRDIAEVGVADKLRAREECFKAFAMCEGSDIARYLSDGILRSHGSDMAKVPKVEEFRAGFV